MFGANKIVKPAAYEKVTDRLMVTSVFYTLQGEGPYQGMPATFIRLTGCGLACAFCDAYFDTGELMTFDAIYAARTADMTKKVSAEAAENRRELIVITGGEPLIQAKALMQFYQYLKEKGHHQIQFETAGYLPFHTNEYYGQYVMSPKINAKTGKPIKFPIENLYRAMAVKCVVSSTEPGYMTIPNVVLEHVAPHNIYLSPMNMYLRQPERLPPGATLEARSEFDERVSFWKEGLLDREKNMRNHEHAAALAMKHGARLTLQMHLYANLP